jgi:ArsR family transcriptional regulator
MRNFPSPFNGHHTSLTDAEALAAALTALAHPARLQILSILYRQGESNVLQIRADMGRLTQPTVSHHLMLLRQAGLVASHKIGPYVFYRLQPQVFAAVATAIGVPS